MGINRPKEAESKMSNIPKFHQMPSYLKLCPHWTNIQDSCLERETEIGRS